MRNFRKAGHEEYHFPVAVLSGVLGGVFFGAAIGIFCIFMGHAIFGVKEKANVKFFGNILYPASITVCAIGGALIAIIRRPKRAPLPPGIEEAIQTRFTPSTPTQSSDDTPETRIKQPDSPDTTEPDA